MAFWNIEKEPIGTVYQDLLSLAFSRCQIFSFDRKIGQGLGEKQARVELLIEPFLVKDRQKDQEFEAIRKEIFTDPNIRLIEWYWLRPDALNILREVSGLYSWLNPELPENLSFHLANGETWLHSYSPEQDSWIQDSDLTTSELLNLVPGIMVLESG